MTFPYRELNLTLTEQLSFDLSLAVPCTELAGIAKLISKWCKMSVAAASLTKHPPFLVALFYPIYFDRTYTVDLDNFSTEVCNGLPGMRNGAEGLITCLPHLGLRLLDRERSQLVTVSRTTGS